MKRLLSILVLLCAAGASMGQTWILEHQKVFTSAATTNPATTNINTVDSGLTDEWNATPPSTTWAEVWYNEPGGVITVPVATGGSGYSTAPTVTLTPTYGSGSKNFAPAATANISGGAVTSVTITNAGWNIASCTASLSGGGYSVAATLGTPTISGSALRSAAGLLGYNNYGYEGWLLRAAPQLGSYEVQVGHLLESTGTIIIDGRINPTTNQAYSIYGYNNSGNWAFQLNYLNAYPTNSATTVHTWTTSIPYTVGHVYSCGASFTGSSPTSIIVQLNDDTSNSAGSLAYATRGTPSFTSSTVTDSSAGVQAANYLGTSAYVSQTSIEELDFYQPGGFSFGTNPIGLNQTVSEVITGTGTSWSSNPFASGFNANGTGATMGSVTVNSASSITTSFTTGSTAGTILLTDSTTGITNSLTVSPIVMAAPVVTATSRVGPATITATAAAQYAVFTGNCTYSVWRSTSANWPIASGSTATQIGTSYVTASSSTTPWTTVGVVDSSPPGGPAFYTIKVTDGAGQVAYSPSAYTSYSSNYSASKTWLLGLGHSLMAGSYDTNQQWCGPPIINVAGSGYTANTFYPLTISAPTGTQSVLNVQATGYVHSNASGTMDYAYLVNPGWGYATAPTITCAAPSSGTQATLQSGSGSTTAGPNGGWFLDALLDLGKWSNAAPNAISMGFGGAATQSFLPLNSQAVISINNGLVTLPYNHGLSSAATVTINYWTGSAAATLTGYVGSPSGTTFQLYTNVGLTTPSTFTLASGAWITATGLSNTNTTQPYLEMCFATWDANSVAASGNHDVIPIELDENDANGSVSAATFQANMAAIVAAIYSHYSSNLPTILFVGPVYNYNNVSPAPPAFNASDQAYNATYPAIITAFTKQNPSLQMGTIGQHLFDLSLQIGSTMYFSQFTNAHLSTYGYALVGGQVAMDILPYLGIPGAQYGIPNNNQNGGNGGMSLFYLL